MEGEELKYWLWWNRVPGIGPIRFYKLLEVYGSMADAWRAPLRDLKAVVGEKALAGLIETRKTWDPEQEFNKVAHLGFRIYCHPDPGYPPILKKIADPPPVLYAWGGFEYGDDIAVAIIGTRNPTPVGAFNARDLAAQLTRQGLTIISGMARGIDSEAHKGAIQASGRTIAVLGCGLDIPYPPENEPLMEQIAGSGVVISEFPLGTKPLAQNFPARNRIISGLSLGVVVVEAAKDSGSLITAGFALEQGREVFAVPGSIGNEGSKGPHKLIRQGAKLVETYQDILNELSIPQLSDAEIVSSGYTPANEMEARIITAMNREPLHIDQILRRSGLASAQVNAALVQLELKGAVKRFPGQMYLRIK
ncbi:MAG: DNA-processing protein DprA [Bacillota bacterium]